MNFQKKIFEELQLFLKPLIRVKGNSKAIDSFFREFGWDINDENGNSIASFINSIENFTDAAGLLSLIIANPPKNFEDLIQRLRESQHIIDQFNQFPRALPNLPLSVIDTFVDDLITNLTVRYLFRKSAFVFHLLRFLTIIEEVGKEHIIVDQRLIRQGILDYIVHWERLTKLISDPKQLIEQEYWPGGLNNREYTNEAAQRFFSKFSDLLSVLEFNSFVGRGNGPISFNPSIEEKLKGIISFQRNLFAIDTATYNEIGGTLGLIPQTEGGPGFYFIPRGSIQLNEIISNWLVSLSIGGNTRGFVVTPKGVDFLESQSSNQLKIELLFERSTPGSNNLLIGSLDGSHLSIGSTYISSKLHLTPDGDEAGVGLMLHRGKFVLSPGDGSSLFSRLIPISDFSVDFDLEIGYSTISGFYFGGSAGLEIYLPLHLNFHLLKVKGLILKIGSPAWTFEVNTNLKSKLGPLEIDIKKIGIKTQLTFTSGGNLGFTDVKSPGFNFPNSLAAKLNTPLISGGGFLNRREDGYDGILALSMKALDLTGIAVLTTKMPNGEDGFSLIVSINVIFFPPIQLSFGFTLAGVGGLIGVNRTMKVDTLRQRIADGAMNSIMFPENPIENADRIIGDLRSVFPPQEGHFVIAPFLRIGFGTPTIVKLDLGIVLEFPFSGRVILLGSLGVYLPSIDSRKVEINIDVLGDFNFAEEYIRVEGRLRQSHILSIPLKGGFAFMLDWGKQPAFLFSIGGYHPRYKKPARFPEIPRLNAVVRIGDVVTLSCDYYQAITSNSFQIGFAAFMKASAMGASLEGRFSFNTLLQFNPFFFSVDMGMSVKLKYKGKTLAGVAFYYLLSGPSPWTAAGYAEVSILFITLKINFRVQSGEAEDQPKTYEPIDSLLAKVTKSLEAPANWTAKLPPGFRTAESLRPAAELNGNGTVLHPSGYLQVRQTALPFEHRIGKYGNSYVREKPKFSFHQNIRIGDVEARVRSSQLVKENFARGQFEDLSNAEKLSSPDFEEFVAGLSFGSGQQVGFAMGADDLMESVAPRAFEEIVVFADLETNREGLQLSTAATQTAQRLGQVRSSIRRREGPLVTGPPGAEQNNLALAAPEPRYQVLNAADLAPVEATSSAGLQVASFASYGAARQYITHELPQANHYYQILPVHGQAEADVIEQILILDDFRSPTNSREMECGAANVSPDAPLVAFPLELTTTEETKRKCWQDNDLRFPVLAVDSYASQAMIRTTQWTLGVNPAGEAVAVRYAFVPSTGNGAYLHLNSAPGISTMNVRLKYELDGGAFFNLAALQGLRLHLIRNGKAADIHAYVYLYDDKNHYWSNIVDNQAVIISQNALPQQVEILFDELRPKQSSARYPDMKKIKNIHVFLVSKEGGDDLVLDKITLF